MARMTFFDQLSYDFTKKICEVHNTTYSLECVVTSKFLSASQCEKNFVKSTLQYLCNLFSKNVVFTNFFYKSLRANLRDFHNALCAFHLIPQKSCIAISRKMRSKQEQFQQQLFNGSIQRCSPNLSFQKRKPLVTKINLKSGLELFFPPLFQENFRNVIFKICHVFNDISHLNIQFWRVQSSKQLSIHWNWNHWRVELENFWNLDFNHDGNLFTFVSVPKMLPTLYWQE